MFRSQKGQVAILVGLALLAAIIIGGGFTLGSLQETIKLVINNWVTLFVSVLGLSVAATFVINSWQKKPKWKKDIAGLAILVGLMLAIAFIPTVSGTVTTYTATVDIRAENLALTPPQIESVQISDFKSTNPFSVFRAGRLAIMGGNFDGHLVVTCEGEKRDETTVKLNVASWKWEPGLTETMIKNLPQGKPCTLTVEMINKDNNKKVDEVTKSFTVPRGEK